MIQHQPTTPRHPSQITHDSTESVQDLHTNPPNTSSTVTDSNALLVLTRDIIEHNNYLYNQENPSTLSVTNTSETHHLQYTIQYNEIMIHHLLHPIILLIVPLIIHLNKGLPIHFLLDNHLQMKLSSKQQLHQYNPLKQYHTFLLNHLYNLLLLLHSLLILYILTPLLMFQLLVPYHDLLYHSFKITHFRRTLLVLIYNHKSVSIIHNLTQI